MGLLGIIGSIAGNYFGGPIGGTIGGTIGGALDGSMASDSAANSQRDSSNASLDLQKRQYETAYADQAPYRAQGVNALGQLATAINTPTSAADVMNTPGYQFGLDQGQLSIDRQIAASGGRVSGNAIKEAAKFGTNYATTAYGAADQRRENRLARLQTLAGLGQSATSASGANGMAYGQNAGAQMVNQGDNAGRASLYQGGVWANAGNQIAAAYGRATQPPSYQPSYQSGSGFGSVSGGYVDPGTGQTYNNPSAYSDARLKKNIRQIGITARGNTICAWDWKTGGSGVGVIAQDVAHIPGAVHDDADGLLMVDYSKV